MTLDDLLKERECEVTFSRGDEPGKIMCVLASARPGEDRPPFRNKDGVMVTFGRLHITWEGRSASDSFSNAVQKLRSYLESLK